jgi:hypothetical protein
VEDLPRLEELRLEGSQVSAAAVTELAKRRPELVIEHPAVQPPFPTGRPAP